MRKNFWESDQEAILAIMIVLIVLGTINVFSSSFVMAEADYNNPYFFLKKQLANVLVGSVFFFICWYVDYHKWRDYLPFILAATIITLLLVLIIGPSVNGAKRWLPLPLFQVQPAEFAKLVSIMMMAAYLSHQVKLHKEITIFNRQTGVAALMFILTEVEPDMGTACIILGVPLVMTVVAGLSADKMKQLVTIAVTGVVVMCLIQPYRLERIKVTYDPWSDAERVGYQTVQSLSAIGSGGFFGMGLGVGASKYDYLPEGHTDFAFAIFCQENGFLGAILVFMLYAAFTVYAARIAARAADIYGEILSIGILILIVGQGVVNLLMVGGMFPVVGVPLPFISYGGTSLLVNMSAMGILANIGKKGDAHEAEVEEARYLAELERSRDPFGLKRYRL